MAQIPLSEQDSSVEPQQTDLISPLVDRTPPRTWSSIDDMQSAWHKSPAPDQGSKTSISPDIAETVVRNLQSHHHGLGLTNVQRPTPSKVKTAGVGMKDYLGVDEYFTPTRVSEPAPGSTVQATAPLSTAYGKNDEDSIYGWPTPFSSRQTPKDLGPTYHHIPSETNLLPPHQNYVHDGCPTNGDVLKMRWGWYCSVVIILSLFSTLFSGIFLGIAIRKPRWDGLKSMPIETATLLSALFSKLIELTFACVFVATLGQILSRKAFVKRSLSGKSGGVTIAEMNMRLWILQPGTLLTHWTGAWFALRTALGGFALVAAIAAALYITAAEALVSPKLAFGRNETRVLAGAVSTIYSNALYLNLMCETPVTKSPGPSDEEGRTCMQVKHAGQAFRNFETWTTQWAEKIASASVGSSNDWRPPPVALMFDNTTVQGQWISPSGENITTDSERHGRLIHNVTLAMPHPNIVHAVRAPRNNILQPEDLRGDGEYYVQAAVPAPALNILCAGMSSDEIKPMHKDTPDEPGVLVPTVVDGIFGFTQDRAEQPAGDYAPTFAKLPIEFNVLMYKSRHWGQHAIYILTQPPKALNTSDYVLCALKSTIYTKCTTSYHVAQAGSELSVHCDDGKNNDPGNNLPYLKFNPKAPSGIWDNNWPSIGELWGDAVALSQGVSDANASIARYLTQMTPRYAPDQATLLDPKFPSLSEALGVLAGSTLLISADNSPFMHAWTYNVTDNWLPTPAWQEFHSLVSYKDYTSGRGAPWQTLFYLVLFAVFFINLFCLLYLLWKFYHDGEVTDYTEPQNLFALAINSPPSNSMSGSCGPGPTGEMLRKKWMVEMSRPLQSRNTPIIETQQAFTDISPAISAAAHPHFYVRCPDDDTTGLHSPLNIEAYPERTSGGLTKVSPGELSYEQGPEDVSNTHDSRFGFRSSFNPARLWSPNQSWSRRRRVIFRSRSVNSVHDDSPETTVDSPAVDQYLRLSRHH